MSETNRLGDSDSFLRRLFPSQIVDDENLGRRRPSSAGIARRPDESNASVYVRSLLEEADIAPSQVLHEHSGMGVVGADLSVIRDPELNYDVIADPDGVDPDHAHPCDSAHGGIVEPAGISKRAADRRRSNVAKALTVWVDPEMGVDLLSADSSPTPSPD